MAEEKDKNTKPNNDGSKKEAKTETESGKPIAMPDASKTASTPSVSKPGLTDKASVGNKTAAKAKTPPADKKPKPASPVPAAKKSNWGTRIILGIIVLVIVSGAGLGVYPRLAQMTGLPSLGEPLDGLSHMIAEATGLSGSGDVEQPTPVVQTPSAAVSVEANETIDLLEREVADLTARLSSYETKMSSYETSLASVQSELAQARTEAQSTGNDLTSRVDLLEARPLQTASVAPSVMDTSVAASGDDGAAVADVNRRIVGLMSRLDAVEKQASDQDAKVSRFDGALAELGSTVKADVLAVVEPRLQDADTRLADLGDQMATVDVQLDASGAGTAALAFGMSNLQRALDAGTAYEVELSAVRTAIDKAGFDAAADMLGVHAQDGVPTIAGISNRFADAARAMLVAAAAGKDPGWQDKALARLKNIVSIRKVGDLKGDGVEPVIARMESAIEARDLSSALRESTGLPDEARTAVTQWLDDLALRVASDDALREISAGMIARVSSNG